MGDPCSIAPEIIVRAMARCSVRNSANIIIAGDRNLLIATSKKLKLKEIPEKNILNLSNLKNVKPGKPTKETALATIQYIEEAVKLIKEGKADALVTAPINKEALKKANFKYPGHTEFLAHLTNTKDFVMMLGGKDLKVVLVTIHEPLKDVAKLITKKKIISTVSITNDYFKKNFKIKKPRICVTGLNPHAGEKGMFGTEEQKIITPAIKELKKQNINVTGPVPADSAFYFAHKGDYDVVVSMYHDQALGPLKLIHFEDGVNYTMGLPFIRTSVDHGTGYDIAGKGKASEKSLVAAIKIISEMA